MRRIVGFVLVGFGVALLALGVLLLVAPDAIPALTVPAHDAMPPMTQMDS